MTIHRWLDPAWQGEALHWVDERLRGLGRRRVGPPAQPHVRPWATALRIPTGEGPVWLKASAPGTAYEHGLLRVLGEVVPDRVLAPLASDPGRAWSLLPDGGATLREWLVEHADQRFGSWVEVVREHAALQRASAYAVDRLLAAGTPDLRPGALPRQAWRRSPTRRWIRCCASAASGRGSPRFPRRARGWPARRSRPRCSTTICTTRTCCSTARPTASSTGATPA